MPGKFITEDVAGRRAIAVELCKRFNAQGTEQLVSASKRHLRENKELKDAPIMRYIAAAAITAAGPDLESLGEAVDFAATLLGIEVPRV